MHNESPPPDDPPPQPAAPATTEGMQLMLPCSHEQLALLQAPYAQRETASKVKPKKVRARLSDTPLVSRFHVEERFRNAAHSGDLLAVERYLDEDGVDVNCADEKKRTALHFASTRGSRAMVELLLSHGANVNLRDCNHNCPLHLAACTNHIEIITLLLRAGTDVMARDRSGSTPLHYAQSRLNFLFKSRVVLSDADRRNATFQVVELLQAYMRRAGDARYDAELEDLSRRMCTIGADTDVDAVGALLHNLTSLTLERLDGKTSESRV